MPFFVGLPLRAGPRASETCDLAPESAGQQTQGDGRAQGTRRRHGAPSVLLPSMSGGTAPLPVQVVHINEPKPSEGVKPWFLITMVAVSSFEDAMRVVGWYALRWRIEDRALKSGCEAEETGHRSASRARDQRRHRMALLARETPNGSAELLFSDLKLLVIGDYATKLPRTPKTLKAAALIVAIMAGAASCASPSSWRSRI